MSVITIELDPSISGLISSNENRVLLTGVPGAPVKEPKRSNFALKSIVF
jgi:hypothetical protein